MKTKIKTHLETQLQVLKQLCQCLEEESEVLRKGTSDDVMSMVYRKQQFIRQLDELEGRRLQLLKTETFESLKQKYPEDEQLKHYHEAFLDCCQTIQQLSIENQELTLMAKEVILNRMAFYTELVQQSQTANSTYTRGGAYTKTKRVGSTILERTL